MSFYQKYRSKNFGELVGQEHISQTIREAVKTGKIVHAYLFTGPRGIGKTSTARILAKAINCETLIKLKKDGKDSTGEPCDNCQSCKDIAENRSVDIMEIDAASHTGVDDVREIIERARLAPTRSAKKVYIIDEVHMLSKAAFNALLKTLEEPPAHVVFIMATTEVQKIPATILSRAQRYDFHRATKDEIIKNLKYVAKSEGITIDDDSLDLIALAAEGGHRDSLSLLEQAASLQDNLTIVETRNILGIPKSEEVFQFLGAIFDNNPEEGLKIARALFVDGSDMVEFNKSIIASLRKMMLMSVSRVELFDDTKENISRMSSLIEKTTIVELNKLIKIFVEAGNMLKDVSYPILPLEMAVVEASALNIDNNAKVNQVPISETPKTIEQNKSTISTEIEKTISSIKPAKDISPQEVPSAKIDDKKVEMPATSSKLQAEKGDKQSDKIEDKNETVEASENKSEPKVNTGKVAVPVWEMTDDLWSRIVDEIKKENTSLAALLRDAKPLEVTSELVNLSVKFAFHKDKISETKNSQFLEKIICEVTGNNCQVKCTIAEPKSKIEKAVDPEEIKKAVEEIFE
ncbi:MAG: DNA polymerase III subunit gamma/tau [bacterium]